MGFVILFQRLTRLLLSENSAVFRERPGSQFTDYITRLTNRKLVASLGSRCLLLLFSQSIFPQHFH